MLLKNKNYKINKIDTFLNKNYFVFITSKINKNSENLKSLTKKMHTKFSLLKLNNNILKYKKLLGISYIILNNSLFLLKVKNNKTLLKTATISIFSFFYMYALALNLNDKTYSINKFKQMSSLNYSQNKNKLIQICLIKLKKNIFVTNSNLS